MKLLLTCFFTGAFVFTLQGQIYVKVNATGANNGTSWANAYTSLGSALASASSGSQLWVASGIYKPDRDSLGNLTPTDNRDKTFVLKNGVALYGGFAGTETTLLQRNVATNATILSGEIGSPSDSTDNIYQMIQVRNLTAATRLDGVTVTLGFMALGRGRGGSALNMLNGNMFLTIANCLFSNNSNYVAVYCAENSGLTIEKTTFYNNYNVLQLNGGALYCKGPNNALSLNLTDCVFTKNSGGQGGAISTELKMTAVNCEFESNRVNGSSATLEGLTSFSGGKGGAIYSNTDLSLTDCVFYTCLSRTTINMSVYGGAIYQETGKLKLESCGFLGNVVACLGSYFQFASGGAVYTGGADTCFVNNCLFYSNYAQGSFAGSGAGMNCGRKTSIVTNSVFNKNEVNAQAGANSGGGYSNGGNSTITNCTFVKNKAGSGAGILTSSSGGTTTIQNTLFWNNVTLSNTTDANTQIHNLSPSVTTIAYSLIQSGVPPTVTNGGNNLSSDPLLVNESDVFGPDMSWPSVDDGFRLQAGSPAAATGTLIGAPRLDVLGTVRPNPPSMGAYQKEIACTLSISSVAVQNATCSLNNGRLTIQSVGNNGLVTYSLDSVNYQASNLFSNLGIGNYRVFAKDANACMAIPQNQVITNLGTRPIVAFTVSVNNLIATFTNNSTNLVNPTTYVWRFGNGQTSTQANPSFNYGQIGNYTAQLVVQNNGLCVDSTSRTVQILTNPTVDIEPLNLLLYPNPVKEQLTIQSPKSLNIRIVNSVGQTVQKLTLKEGETKIEVNNWSKGVYFLQGQGINLKFVKQ